MSDSKKKEKDSATRVAEVMSSILQLSEDKELENGEWQTALLRVVSMMNSMYTSTVKEDHGTFIKSYYLSNNIKPNGEGLEPTLITITSDLYSIADEGAMMGLDDAPEALSTLVKIDRKKYAQNIAKLVGLELDLKEEKPQTTVH